MKALEYFKKYVSVDTQSDENSGSTPSTQGQLELAGIICRDLADLGIDAQTDEYGYVYGTVPATAGCEDLPAIGLIAHMDTSDAASGQNIRMRVVDYAGGDVMLNEEKNIVLSEAEYPEIAKHAGKHLIVTDGTTLLGADDKAGVSEILALCAHLTAHPEEAHGTIRIAFTPDEEIGRGADHFDVERFAAQFAYTVDGGALGELEYENFNAAAAQITIKGISMHPGSSKGKMVNAALIACEFAAQMPEDQRPDTTEKYEGFFHLCALTGDCKEASLQYIIRDHDAGEFARKKEYIAQCVDAFSQKYPKAQISVQIRDSYYNMKEVLKDRMDIIDRAADAMRACGVEPIVQPIRGGTDGSRLSFMGLPCPNLSTGGYNFHSRFEYIPLEDMDTMVDVLRELVRA